MCTVLLAWRCVPGAPLLLAANRDELIARPSAPAGILVEGPSRIAGGRDLLAGGTWLAVAADGRVAAVTNRHVGERDPTRRSRGEIPVALLSDPDPLAWLDRLDPTAYNPANVLLASPDRLAVRHLTAAAEGTVWLGPGVHVLTTVDVDDLASEKVGRLLPRLEAAVTERAGAVAALAGMEAILADHGPDGGRGLGAACVHLERYGTVSTSSVAVDDDGRVAYRFGSGPACTAERQDVSGLLDGPPTTGARVAREAGPSPHHPMATTHAPASPRREP